MGIGVGPAQPDAQEASSSAAQEPGVKDLNTPTVTFESLTFSDGTKIELDANDVVAFVGPNNAGKSLALRELEDHVRSGQESKVVKSVDLGKSGTQEEFLEYFHKHVQVKTSGTNTSYYGYGFSFSVGGIPQLWPNQLQLFHQFFCMRISTETRITASNPTNSIAVLDEPASHPIHMLFSDDRLARRLSKYFRRAFGEDMIVYHLGGRTIPLLVGERPGLKPGEDRISTTFCERLLTSTVPLSEQGDGMRSFASVILHLLAPITPSILLLDEPEAFLHPPQARLLGEIIATEKSSRAQLFLATHSPDVLQGLINVAPDHLRVLRMQRIGNVNRIKELDKELVREISVDPLMRYSSVMSGVFHKRVIICEADADCMFYNSILDLSEVHGEGQPDVLFIHASGKDRMSALAKALVALDVPVDVVADIDILNDTGAFGRVVDSLGGDSAVALPLAEAVKKAIEQHKPWLSVDEIKNGIKKELGKDTSDGESAKQLRSRIDAIFRQASPWDAVKLAGEVALPPGQATQQFQKLQALCKQMGLWIVPVGELEGFCKSIGGHGPRWVQQVIEERDLVTDPDLERARKFVRDIWRNKQVSAP